MPGGSSEPPKGVLEIVIVVFLAHFGGGNSNESQSEERNPASNGPLRPGPPLTPRSLSAKARSALPPLQPSQLLAGAWMSGPTPAPTTSASGPNPPPRVCLGPGIPQARK
uniref:Uncharacterized protein n=1 Tax=Ananas comosus var. bracteatus TaxID=296719 RepID=A0A6V7QU80_ANACO